MSLAEVGHGQHGDSKKVRYNEKGQKYRGIWSCSWTPGRPKQASRFQMTSEDFEAKMTAVAKMIYHSELAVISLTS